MTDTTRALVTSFAIAVVAALLLCLGVLTFLTFQGGLIMASMLVVLLGCGLFPWLAFGIIELAYRRRAA